MPRHWRQGSTGLAQPAAASDPPAEQTTMMTTKMMMTGPLARLARSRSRSGTSQGPPDRLSGTGQSLPGPSPCRSEDPDPPGCGWRCHPRRHCHRHRGQSGCGSHAEPHQEQPGQEQKLQKKTTQSHHQSVSAGRLAPPAAVAAAPGQRHHHPQRPQFRPPRRHRSS